MSSITVSTTSQLNAALKSASAGDTIYLEAGTYSGVMARGLSFASNVMVTSKNPDDPAVITSMTVRDASGITFESLELKTTGQTVDNPFQVINSSKINLSKLDVHGSDNGNVADDISAMIIRESRDITLTNSQFYDLWIGVNLFNIDGLKISGNEFRDIGMDGVRGGGVSNALITNNFFTDFYPAPGEHPDAIQLWTRNTTESARDIVITDNVIVRGDGAPVQGIFLRDQDGDKPYLNVQITGNTLVGTLYNGIMVQGGKNLQIADNSLTSFTDQKTWIRVEDATGVAVSSNESLIYMYERVTDLTQSGNITNAAASDGGLAALRTWLVENKAAASNLLDGVRQEVGGVVSPPAAQPVTPPVVVSPPVTPPVVVLPPQPTPVVTPPAAPQPAGVDVGVEPASLLAPSSSLVGLSSATTYTLKAGETGLSLTGAQSINGIGNNGNDTITGNDARNMIAGRAGDDDLRGGGGDDYISGDAGNDLVSGGTGNDDVHGAAGNDTVWGGDGADTVAGEDGNDLLYGDVGNDLVDGGTGADTMFGGGGNDQLVGGAGDDRLWGGDGNDTLSGDTGNDIMTGGDGADRFNLGKNGGADIVTDFSLAEGDQVKLTGVKSYTLTQVGSDAVVDIGGGAKLTLLGVDIQDLYSANWVVTG